MAYPSLNESKGDYGYGQSFGGYPSYPSRAGFGQKVAVVPSPPLQDPSSSASPPAESSSNFPVVLGWILVGGGGVLFIVVVIIAIVLIVKYCKRQNGPQTVQTSTEQYPPGQYNNPGHFQRPPQYVYPKNGQLNEYDYPEHFIRPENYVPQQAQYPNNSIRHPEHNEQFELSNRPGLPQHPEAPKPSGESEVTAHLENRQDPIYESIPGYEPMRSFRRPAADMCLRPPYPLPPDVLAQSGRYIHYDTPYEDRIFRLGRLRCERNPNGGGHVVIAEPQDK